MAYNFTPWNDIIVVNNWLIIFSWRHRYETISDHHWLRSNLTNSLSYSSSVAIFYAFFSSLLRNESFVDVTHAASKNNQEKSHYHDCSYEENYFNLLMYNLSSVFLLDFLKLEVYLKQRSLWLIILVIIVTIIALICCWIIAFMITIVVAIFVVHCWVETWMFTLWWKLIIVAFKVTIISRLKNLSANEETESNQVDDSNHNYQSFWFKWFYFDCSLHIQLKFSLITNWIRLLLHLFEDRFKRWESQISQVKEQKLWYYFK